MVELLDRLTTALATRYRVGGEVGRGGMASVYLAEDLRHERRVAIKVLRPELAAALGSDRFLREIKLTAQLNHPHILPLLDSGEADGLLYYVMPYVAGESLRDRLNRDKQLAIDDALRIVRDVADALDFAHAHGIVHRDIKPENILLSLDHAVVADFGIARAIGSAGGANLTATGVSIGTPHYMSPEQGSGDAVDRRADIYALGCVTFEMLAGEPPFTGHSAQVIIARHVSERPPSLCAVRPTLSAAADIVVHRALAKVPADRFPSAGEFAIALGGAAAGPLRPLDGAATALVGATPPAGRSAGPTTSRRGSRRTAAVYATGALLVVLALVLIRDMVGPRAGPQSRPAPSTSPTVGGRVSDGGGNPLADVQITVDGVDVRVYTTTAGQFLADLPRVEAGDVIVLRATRRGYEAFSEVRRVSSQAETFDIVLQPRP